MALIVGRRTFGKTWGLKPRRVQRLYTALVRPRIIYGSQILWPKVNKRQAVGKLSSVQSSACLCITGAIRSTHTAAIETLLNLSPLEIFIEGEARMGAHRLKCNDSGRNWNTGTPE
jgi:hypothetical protein